MRKVTDTARAAVGMGAIVAFSRAMGFARVLVVAAVLGTSYLGNAFQAANSLSNVLFELLAAGALSAVLVPTFVRLMSAGDTKGAQEVAGGILGVAVLGLGAVAVGVVAAAPLIARLLTLGVPPEVVTEQRELVTFLLRFFAPQVVMYGAGTIAIAVLHARRRFAVTVAAPIGSTVVMVACLLAFGASVQGPPGFDLSAYQRWLLVAAGTGGVAAFVGVLLAACRASGFHLWPRLRLRDPRVHEVLRQSGWGVMLHSAAGLLLGAAIMAGSAVEGAVVAYQVGWVFFLAPFGILSQPVQTAILPELVSEGAGSDLERFRTSVRWALERIALFVLPVTAAMAALALPGMRLVAFGEAADQGPRLLAAAVAALGVGLFPYGAFLLLARAYYALNESRFPGVVAVAASLAGVGVMAIGALTAGGAGRVAMLGAGHTLAYTLGCVVLLRSLGRRTGGSVMPKRLATMAAVSAAAGLLVWLASRVALEGGSGRLYDLAVLAASGVIGGGLVFLGYRLSGLPAALTQRPWSLPQAPGSDPAPGGTLP
ncbi:MAG: lipid II flippase MurJ [Actinomycetota bacterium]